MGKYDLKAQFDLISDKTNTQKITYVGYSQGSTQMFYALATENDYWR